MSTNIAADRLYLLWCIEEQILSGLGGHISQEHALRNCLGMINESGPEMVASDDEKHHLQAAEGNFGSLKGRAVEDLGGLIVCAEQYLTPEQFTYPQGTEE